MSQVKRRPQKKATARNARKPGQSPTVTAAYKNLSDKAATYALGTVIAGASMALLAAWMGGSLGTIDRNVQSGFDVAARATGLTVSHVLAPGLDPRTKADVLNAAAVEPGENMFRADPHRIKARVETLQSVGRVGVLRLWPDQIMIIAEPRRPLATWQTAGAWGVVDENGNLMPAADAAEHVGLPRIVGADGGLAAPSLIQALKSHPEIQSRLETALRVGERRWDLRLTSGAELILPEDGQLDVALEAVEALHAQSGVLDLQLERIDVRDPHRFALRPVSSVKLAGLPSGGA